MTANHLLGMWLKSINLPKYFWKEELFLRNVDLCLFVLPPSPGSHANSDFCKLVAAQNDPSLGESPYSLHVHSLQRSQSWCAIA